MLKLTNHQRSGPQNASSRAIRFAKPYFLAAAGTAYLFAAGWRRPRNRALILQLCDHFGLNYGREVPTLPQIGSAAVAPENVAVEVRALEAREGNVNGTELVIICRIAQTLTPQRIFEFGTFDGRTTLNLAANAPGAEVITIDLPRGELSSLDVPIDRYEVQYADKDRSGVRYSGTDVQERVKQLYGNSGTFDFSPYYETVDLVFIDASHAYEYVINDSLHAQRMLRGGKGVIIWHDYAQWDSVTRALHDLRERESFFRELQWIRGTSLAVLKKTPL